MDGVVDEACKEKFGVAHRSGSSHIGDKPVFAAVDLDL
jgi:hypothetical protein